MLMIQIKNILLGQNIKTTLIDTYRSDIITEKHTITNINSNQNYYHK